MAPDLGPLGLVRGIDLGDAHPNRPDLHRRVAELLVAELEVEAERLREELHGSLQLGYGNVDVGESQVGHGEPSHPMVLGQKGVGGVSSDPGSERDFHPDDQGAVPISTG